MEMSASEQLRLMHTQVLDVFPFKCKEPGKGQHISTLFDSGKFKKKNKPLTIDPPWKKSSCWKVPLGNNVTVPWYLSVCDFWPRP